MSRAKDMTIGNPASLILTFALPLICGNLGQQLYMIVDTIIVGQGVGVEALAALGATDWIYWLVLWTVQAMTQGFAILIAQHFGAGKQKELKKSITMSIVLCMITGALLTVISLSMARPMLTLLHTPDTIVDGAYAYLTTMCGGTLIVSAYNMISAILRSFGDGKTPLIGMGIAAAVNIGLDLLFVLVFGFGITGAAVATLIAQFIALLYCTAVLCRMENLKFCRADWKIDRKVLRRLFGLGFPLAVQHVLIAVGGMVLQSVINGYGFLFVAGFTATNKVYGLLESSALSFGYATTTYMAQNYGARKIDRIKVGIKKAVCLSVTVSVVISATMIIFGKPLLSMFISTTNEHAQEVLDIAYRYLCIMAVLLWILYLLHTYRSALQGLGNTTAPLLSGCVEFGMRIGIALFLPKVLGSGGLFYAEPGAWTGAGILLIAAYYAHVRKICSGQGISTV